MSPESLIIKADFNIHVDDRNNLDSVKFLDLLDSIMGLQQHVDKPAHANTGISSTWLLNPSNGQFNNWKADDGPIILRPYVDIMTTLKSTKPPITFKGHTYRKIKSIDIDLLTKDLAASDLCKHTPES